MENKSIMYQDKFSLAKWFSPIGITLLVVIFPISYLYYILDFGSTFFGNLGDCRFNMLLIENGYQSIFNQKEINVDFFYPAPDVVYYSETHLVNSILYGLFRLIGYDMIDSFVFWIYAIFVLNFGAFFWASRFYKISFFSAFLGAFIFAFALPVIHHSGHMQLIPRYFVPIGIVLILKWRQYKSLHYLILSISCGLAQLLINVYTGIFLFFILGLMTIPIIPTLKRSFQKINRNFYNASLILLILLLLVGFNYYPYLQVSKSIGVRNWNEIFPYLPNPKTLLLVPECSVNWGFLNQLLNNKSSYELKSFIGLVPLIVLFFSPILFIIKKRNFFDVFMLLFALSVSVLLTIKLYSFSLYRYIYEIPGFSALRAICRIILPQLALIALIFSITLDLFIKNGNTFKKLLIFLVFGALVLFDQKVKVIDKMKIQPFKEFHYELIDNFEQIDSDITAFVLSNPKATWWKLHLDGMYISTILGIPTLNGYSGHKPKNYLLSKSKISKEDVDKWINFNFNNKPFNVKIAIINIQGNKFGEVQYINY